MTMTDRKRTVEDVEVGGHTHLRDMDTIEPKVRKEKPVTCMKLFCKVRRLEGAEQRSPTRDCVAVAGFTHPNLLCSDVSRRCLHHVEAERSRGAP